MSDFNLKVTVRNARLLRAIREKFGTSAELCRAANVSYRGVSALLTMRDAPIGKRGEWSSTALKVAAALGRYPDELWPSHIEKIRLKKASAEVEMDRAAVEAIASGETTVLQRDFLAQISTGLTPREVRAVALLIDGATYEEAGAELGGVTRERARQIQMKALRKMREKAARLGVNQIAQVLQ